MPFHMTFVNPCKIAMLVHHRLRRHVQCPSQQWRTSFADMRNTTNAVARISNAWVQSAERCELAWSGKSRQIAALGKNRRRNFCSDSQRQQRTLQCFHPSTQFFVDCLNLLFNKVQVIDNHAKLFIDGVFALLCSNRNLCSFQQVINRFYCLVPT